MENTKYKLKNGILLRSLNFPDALTNANLTDEKAEMWIKDNPKRIQSFEKYPENWETIINNIENCFAMHTELTNISELSRRIFDNQTLDNMQKKTAFENLLHKINCVIPEIITQNKTEIQKFTNFSYNEFVKGILRSEDRIIYLIDDNYNDIVLYENETAEQIEQRQSKLKEFAGTLSIPPVPTGEWETYGNANNNLQYKIQKEEPHPDSIYCETGIYRQYNDFCKTPFFRICLNIKHTKPREFKAVSKLVLLYVAINNELKNVVAELELLGIIVPQQQIATTAVAIIPQTPAEPQPYKTEPTKEQDKTSNKVFIIHGHNELIKEKVARTLSQLGLKPIILHEQTNQGKTIIEKFEKNSSDVGFAIALLTADDEGKNKTEKEYQARARQNVVFEMGYFMGRLGRERVFLLLENGVQKPSDLDGIVYTPLDKSDNWKLQLVKELKAANYNVSADKL